MSLEPLPANDDDTGPARVRALLYVAAGLSLGGVALLAWFLFLQ